VSGSCPGRRTLDEGTLSNHRIGDVISPRATIEGLETEENLVPIPGIEKRFLGHPTMLLYWHSYPGSRNIGLK